MGEYRVLYVRLYSNGFNVHYEELDEKQVKRICREIREKGAPDIAADALVYFIPALPCYRVLLCDGSWCVNTEGVRISQGDCLIKLEKIKKILEERLWG